MKGFCEINGLDAYENYGLVFEPGTYNEVFTLPVPKERYTYDWGGVNGVEVDETEPIVLQARTVNPPFVIIGENKADILAKYNAFREVLLTNVYNDFEFPLVDVRMLLRYTGGGAVTTIGNISGGRSAMRFNIQFSDDFPKVLPILPPSVFDEMIFDDIILA